MFLPEMFYFTFYVSFEKLIYVNLFVVANEHDEVLLLGKVELRSPFPAELLHLESKETFCFNGKLTS
jgi:hypothetical protein